MYWYVVSCVWFRECRAPPPFLGNGIIWNSILEHLGEDSQPVAADNFGDVLVAVAASDQAHSDVAEAAVVFHAVNVLGGRTVARSEADSRRDEALERQRHPLRLR